MRTLELRRHSLRVRPDPHLSPQGIALAQRVGQTMGRYDLVLSSPAPRAIETAQAMGYPPEEYDEPVVFTDAEWRALADLLPEGTPFAQRARVMAGGGLAGAYARKLAARWAALAARLPEGGAALVISHGGYLDDSAVACLPQADHAAWGPNFRHCEGIRLAVAEGRFVGGELLRVPEELAAPPPTIDQA